MKTLEQTNTTGTVELVLVSKDGEAKRSYFKNLVVNTGKNLLAARFLGETVDTITHIAVGTGSEQTNALSTALTLELARVEFESVSRNTNVISYNYTLGAGVGTGLLREAGMFNAASGGEMFCRTVFPTVVEKGPLDILYVTWNITVN